MAFPCHPNRILITVVVSYAATFKMQLETVLLKLMNLVYCYFWGGCILVGFGINILTFILVVEQMAIGVDDAEIVSRSACPERGPAKIVQRPARTYEQKKTREHRCGACHKVSNGKVRQLRERRGLNIKVSEFLC